MMCWSTVLWGSLVLQMGLLLMKSQLDACKSLRTASYLPIPSK